MSTQGVVWTALEWIGISAAHITIVTGVALLVCCFLGRRAAIRHSVLLAALIGAVLIPPAVVLSETFDVMLVEYSLTDAIRSTLSGASAEVASIPSGFQVQSSTDAGQQALAADLALLQDSLYSAKREFAESNESCNNTP